MKSEVDGNGEGRVWDMGTCGERGEGLEQRVIADGVLGIIREVDWYFIYFIRIDLVIPQKKGGMENF